MERAWRSQAIGYAADINFDFLTYGIAFSLLLIMLVWLLPAAAPGPAWLGILEPFQGEWQGIEEQFSRVFSAVRGVARPAPSSFFGTTLSLGGPVRLGQRAVMDVQTNYGRYWRAAVYDKYTGIGWINTRLDALNLSANDEILNASRGALRADVTQTVKIYLPDQNMLFAAAQPIRFGVPTEIRYGQSAVGPPDPATLDLALVRSRKMIREGDTYTVVSAISVADEDTLRHDSIEYSRWISATYLQLPDDLPPRVRALAQQITEQASNPYDRAAALETYLREHIKYNELVSAPPPGRDGVDYTLFDRPEGYCNYYASAMAVLARAIGIPARIASGYAFGEYKDGAFHVVETNAHSWPELYFPTYGWIEFEPTASQPTIERPKKTEPGSTPEPEFDPNLASRRRSRRELEEDVDLGFGESVPRRPGLPAPRDLALIGGGLIALIGLGATIRVIVIRARRFARLAPAARVYEAMLIRARWLGIREDKSATAFERAQRLGMTLSNARRAVERVADLYMHERYGARPLDPVERASLVVAWDTIRAEWRRGFAAYLVERVMAPPRALRARLERFNSRFTAGQRFG
jgi:transglutaminase-like putative cysteine protease